MSEEQTKPVRFFLIEMTPAAGSPEMTISVVKAGSERGELETLALEKKAELPYRHYIVAETRLQVLVREPYVDSVYYHHGNGNY